ncbi:MAG: TRAP transporter substrate-binding protein [Deltaproteobacteria bacterium]|nr:TRAP transporter substrate-binding protein [Deltaproteobacteria bacterium]
MSKKGMATLLIGCCLVFFLVPAVSAKPIKIIYGSQNPETSWGHKHAIAPYAEKIEKATKGKVKIDLYANQTLCKGKDLWNAAKSGMAHLIWGFHGYWPGMTPLADVISLPAIGYTTAEKGSEILWRLYEKYPEIQAGFKDNHILCLYTSTPYYLITTKKQVKTLEDLKGMKIRMTGGPPTEVMKALGGVPVMIPMPDNYISLQKGVIDGMGAPWEAIHGYRLYEVVKYYTQVPFPAVYFSVSMNKAKWNSLPKDVQDAINSVSGLEGSKFWGRNFFDEARNGVEEKLKGMGKTLDIYQLPESELARWLEVGGKPIWEAWVKKMEGQGHKKAREILNTAIKMAKE